MTNDPYLCESRCLAVGGLGSGRQTRDILTAQQADQFPKLGEGKAKLSARGIAYAILAAGIVVALARGSEPDLNQVVAQLLGGSTLEDYSRE